MEKKEELKKDNNSSTPEYHFGGIKTFSLEEIEKEVLNDNVYLDVFAGSDLRFKTEITPIVNALEIVKKLDLN